MGQIDFFLFCLCMCVLIKVKVKVSHCLIAVGALGLEYLCILGTADERQSPSLSFPCLSLPKIEKGTHSLLGLQREFSSRHMAKPSLELTTLRRLSAPLSSCSNHPTIC